MGGGAGGLVVALVVVVALVAAAAAAASSPDLQKQCAPEVVKLMDCLAYAKGQADAPTDKCCASATDIREKDPTCLCYLIEQTYEGNPSIKELGLQPSRLVQLSTACKITNSNITDCRRLLNIPPSSPAYSIFNSSANSNDTVVPKSAGFMNKVQFTYAMASAVASAVVLSLFS